MGEVCEHLNLRVTRDDDLRFVFCPDCHKKIYTSQILTWLIQEVRRLKNLVEGSEK